MKRLLVTVAAQTLIWLNRPLDRLILALVSSLARPEPKAAAASFPPRILTEPKRFIIDIGRDGFNGYRQHDGRLELVAASSAMSSFVRMMQDMVKVATGTTVVFQIEEAPHGR